MKTFLILFLAVTVATAATTRRKREAYSANLNEYVDNVIGNLQTYLRENSLNSLALPNSTQAFSVKPIWITYSGRLSLWEGLLGDLDTVRRYGDVVLTYADKTIGITAEMGIDTAKVNYQYGAKLIGITADGRVEGRASDIATSISLSANLPEYKTALNYFVIDRIGKIRAKLRGNAVVDWLANAIIALVVPIIKTDITNEVTTVLTKLINGALTGVNDHLDSIVNS